MAQINTVNSYQKKARCFHVTGLSQMIDNWLGHRKRRAEKRKWNSHFRARLVCCQHVIRLPVQTPAHSPNEGIPRINGIGRLETASKSYKNSDKPIKDSDTKTRRW